MLPIFPGRQVFAMRLGEEGFEFKAERKDEGVNHYDVLAVPTTADEAEIRQSCARCRNPARSFQGA